MRKTFTAAATLVVTGALVATGSAIGGTPLARPSRTPALSIANASRPEGNSGATTLSFAVKLSAASRNVVSVRFATADGTAAFPGDYTAASGSLIFRPGQTVKAVAVSVAGDTEVEQNETFTVTISSPRNARIAHGVATGTIQNDDVAKAKPGHFHGPISGGGFVDFDVSPDGATISGLVILPYMSCNPSSGSGVYQFRFADTSPVQPDLSFAANGTGSGVSVSLSGHFVADGSVASGTLQIHLAYDDAGTHYECDTGSTAWAAAWRG